MVLNAEVFPQRPPLGRATIASLVDLFQNISKTLLHILQALQQKKIKMPWESGMRYIAGHLLHVQLEQTHHLEGGHDLLLAKLAFLSDLRLCFKQTDWEKSEMCFSE